MCILHQHKYLARPPGHVPGGYGHRPVTCSVITTNNTKLKPTQLTIHQRLQDPPTLVISTSPPVFNDPSLQSTWVHRAWIAAGCATVLVSLAKAIVGAAASHNLLEPMLTGYIGYILADLASGVYHWGIDNYGDESTPIFGSQIEAFQGHHRWPWIITRRQFANNVHALARAVTFFVLPIDLAYNDPVLHGFVGMCSGCIMFSQQFHAWAHSTKSKLPPLVVELQDVGLLVSRGVWNQFLDQNRIFEALEMVIYFNLGVRPRSWCEPTSGWTEDVETQSQVTLQ
ncbi:hypothetical protein K2173_014385 [Erythroxylum novogranatense]|uniref:Lipid desaturase domain-containing protein n=1 Tax=Erythroxylum novogranatense TaxID=1862640 RepID=A0AAV8S659_9ROSI|nr:hypothetical protein K2173_014385 [Erythroxylum novogranatense]